eukprot:1786511-Pleurochrysis_carterae.AAC.3
MDDDLVSTTNDVLMLRSSHGGQASTLQQNAFSKLQSFSNVTFLFAVHVLKNASLALYVSSPSCSLYHMLNQDMQYANAGAKDSAGRSIN